MNNIRDYKKTLSLPKTNFPMKANLVKTELKYLKYWKDIDLYKKMRDSSKGRKKYILHDGPPYANGHLHAGHAQNKILKDIVVKFQQMIGKDALYIPGWDCHGLPIEWKIEEEYRSQGINKDDINIIEFRQKCRLFAQYWVNIQCNEFKRLGVNAEWNNPYITMDNNIEAEIAREFMNHIINGSLYQGSKPVMWSVVEKTSLAEAEVEYRKHKSPVIWVKFPVISGINCIVNTFVVIWTTTPWTIPANRAICFSNKINYAIYEVIKVDSKSISKVGDKLILAIDLADKVALNAKITSLNKIRNLTSDELSNIKCAHPLRGYGFEFDVPLFSSNHVTNNIGTGFIHIAPGHGIDDYEIGIREKLEIPETINADGKFFKNIPLFADIEVIDKNGKFGNANDIIIKYILKKNVLLAKSVIYHNYPHSWRSKAPVIFRNTPQWFISMEVNDLRKKALNAIDNEIKWYPKISKNRIKSMVKCCPDWVVSRQRTWGVPLCCFTNKITGKLLRNYELNNFIANEFEKYGADIWYSKNAEYFLNSINYNAKDWNMVQDTLDVWFDSGSSHAFVLKKRKNHLWPADLYLEGTDQHRGWFQSSLMSGISSYGKAPYKAVLTHGFVNDKYGKKMSKSLGNGIDPIKISNSKGADILRLWIASTDYIDNIRLSNEAIKTTMSNYRKIRNTMRFLLGNLNNFNKIEKIDFIKMPELEHYILDRLYVLNDKIKNAYLKYDFKVVVQKILNFCTFDLSSFYFDIRKDALYCDSLNSINRRASRTVINEIYNTITVWLAPILSFTMEEVWQTRFCNLNDSVHLQCFPILPIKWKNIDLSIKWSKIREVRKVVTGALEVERRKKRIGSSLESAPEIYITNINYLKLFDGMSKNDFSDLFITSSAILKLNIKNLNGFTLTDIKGVSIIHKMAKGKKCLRSWKIRNDVGSDMDYPELTIRDAEAVRAFDLLKNEQLNKI